MSEPRDWGGNISRLGPTETEKFRDHLLRLDLETRRLRFGSPVSDDFIRTYAARVHELGSVVLGYIEDGEIRGAAELRKLGDTWGHEAEAAFSIEPAFQNSGLGTRMLGRLLEAARYRGVHHLYMCCLSENRRMQRVATKYDAELKFERSEVIGDIVPMPPSYRTLVAEAAETYRGFVLAMLDLQRRMLRPLP